MARHASTGSRWLLLLLATPPCVSTSVLVKAKAPSLADPSNLVFEVNEMARNEAEESRHLCRLCKLAYQYRQMLWRPDVLSHGMSPWHLTVLALIASWLKTDHLCRLCLQSMQAGSVWSFLFRHSSFTTIWLLDMIVAVAWLYNTLHQLLDQYIL